MFWGFLRTVLDLVLCSCLEFLEQLNTLLSILVDDGIS